MKPAQPAPSTRKKSDAISFLPSAALLYNVHDELERLISIFGSNGLARLLGVDPASVSRWKARRSSMSPELRRKVGEIDHVMRRLLQVINPGVAEAWLRGQNAWVNGRPIDALTLGQYDLVLDAIDAHETGAYF